jgi:hypothetical protein
MIRGTTTEGELMLVQDETLASRLTPDRVESRLGRLEFRNGAPTAETAETLFDHLTFVRGVDAFLNAFQLASIRAIRQGFLEVGVPDNEILMFSELMDSKSIFLTPNADTVYFISFIDLTAGPMVFEAPPESLWRRRRHVVPLGDRRRAARARSRRGRVLSVPAARLRRAAA